jgi:hypothetical protein
MLFAPNRVTAGRRFPAWGAHKISEAPDSDGPLGEA